MEKSLTTNTKKFETCEYLEGQICACEGTNINTFHERCFCRDTLKQKPKFILKSNPNECCNVDSDCIEHSQLYCYCTNYVNNTFVKNVHRSVIANLPKEEFDKHAVEKLCYAYGHPPDISCHTFGYKANCMFGFCNLEPINLYYNK